MVSNWFISDKYAKNVQFLFVHYCLEGAALIVQRQRLELVESLRAPLQHVRLLRCQTLANAFENAISFDLIYFDFI